MLSDQTIQHVKLSSWADFAQAADQLEGWVFRGQPNEDWPLSLIHI